MQDELNPGLENERGTASSESKAWQLFSLFQVIPGSKRKHVFSVWFESGGAYSLLSKVIFPE